MSNHTSTENMAPSNYREVLPADSTAKRQTLGRSALTGATRPEASRAKAHRNMQHDPYTGEDSIAAYLSQIGQYELLTAEQEVDLAKLVEKGVAAKAKKDEGQEARSLDRAIRSGKAAKTQFIEANLRLVVSIAKRYPLPDNMELLDLIQEGNISLGHAVDKFDHKKGFKFSTYATFWIRQGIMRSMDDKANQIRIPIHQAEKLRAALRAERDHGTPLNEALADILLLTRPISLNSPIGKDEDAEFGDFIPSDLPGPEEESLNSLSGVELDNLLDILGERQKEILILRFGLRSGNPLTLEETGRHFGVTRERIRQVTDKSLRTLERLYTDADATLEDLL